MSSDVGSRGQNYPLFREERPWSVLGSECGSSDECSCNDCARDGKVLIPLSIRDAGGIQKVSRALQRQNVP